MKARTLIILLVAAIVTFTGAWGQTTKNLSQFSELPEAPNAADWIYMHDTSAGVSKKISPANLFAAMPNPGLTTLGGVKRNAGTAGQFVTGIDSDGSLLYDTPAGGPGGGITLVGSRIPYGDGAGSYTHEAAFYYDASNDKIVVGALGLGTTAQLGVTGGGAFQFLNVTDSESINLSVSPAGNNIVSWDSSTGITQMDMGSISLKVPTQVYNVSAWNGDFTVPTKDAVRDALVALPTGGDVSAAAVFSADNALLRSDGAGTKGAQATGIIVDDSNNVSNVGTFSATTVNTTNLNAGALYFVETSGVGTQKVQLLMGSDYTANRSITIFSDDNDIDMTLPSAGTFTLAATTVAQTWGDGIKQKFNPSGTTAGVNVGSHTADPSSLENGDLWYDSTANELTARINGSNVALGAGGSSPTLAGYRQNPPIIWDEMQYNSWGTSATIGPFGWVVSAANGGSRAVSSASATDTTAPGQVQLSITTTASSASGLPSGNNILFGGGSYTFEARVQIGDLAVTTTEEYTARIGFLDSTTAEPTDGCYFRYSQADASWVAVCRSNNTETGSATDTAVDVVADTWTILTIEVNAAANSCVFKINGTTVRTETANIPSGTSRHTGLGLSLIRSAGAGTSSISMPIDYVALQVGLTSTR